MNHDKGDNMSENNQMPNGWGQNKNIPDSWRKNNKLPDNWNNQNTNSYTQNNSGASPSSTKANTNSESSFGFSDKAKSGVGMLAGVAKKVGGAAKNAAGNAVEYAKSDEAKEKLNAAKNKARSLADGAGSKLTDIKERTGDKINEYRQSKADSDVSVDNAAGDAVVDDTYEDITPDAKEYEDDSAISDESQNISEYEESADENISLESEEIDEHDRAIDDMISAALSSGNEIDDSDDIHDIAEEHPDDESVSGSAAFQTGYKRNIQDSEHNDDTMPKYVNDYTPPKYEDDEITDEEPVKKGNNKKNIIFTVILLAAAVIGTYSLTNYFHQNKSKKSNDIQPAKTDISKDSTETKNTDTSEATITETTVTAISNVTTAESNTPPSVVRVDTSAAVNRALKAHFDRKYEEKKKNPSDYFDKDAKYAVYDVNDDGIDELFIEYNTVASNCTDIYIYNNDNYMLAESIGDGGVSVCLSDHFIMTEQAGGGRYTRIFNVAEGKLVQIDQLSSLGYSYTHNEASISESAYNQLMSQYTSKNLKHIYDTSTYCSSLVDTSVYKEIKNYSIYDTSAASSDFEFYPSSKSATVNVSSGGLNLRATPEYNGEIITMMSKGAEIIDYGSNHSWAYVRYIDGSNTYFGYANKQYIDYHESVTVYPCSRFGHIKLNSGTLRGFNRAYVVDSGALEEYDVSLQNGWSVKAVNYCVSKGITWYELYDADDGDYYGWIDSDFIDFD